MRLFCVWLLLAGCAAAPPPPLATASTTAESPAPAPAPRIVELTRASVVPGERIELALTFRGIEVGRVETTAGQPGNHDGHAAVVYQSRAVGTGVVELISNYVGELTTTVDLDGGFALAMHKEEWFEILGKAEHDVYSTSYPRDERRHDFHTAIGAIRGWSSHPGERAKVTISVGGNLLAVRLVDIGRAIHPASNTPAVKYAGTFDCGCGGPVAFTLWISDDLARVPLRVTAKTRWGTARAELASYSAPPE